MDQRSVIAAVRFGLGRRPGDPEPGDPVAWLDRQLAAPPRALPGPSLAEALSIRTLPPPERGPRAQAIYRAEAQAHFGEMLVTDQPFRERLVAFWANHLAVSARGPLPVAVIGDYVRSAIRPHVTGRFAEMLLASTRHPAMLVYLDNANSIGPNSPMGRRVERGLNENLAREILELHSVSPAAGYTQADVTEFARILTGWGFNNDGFTFNPRRHEPGPKTLMGRHFPPGEQGGIEALTWLANHPATHRHLATKLARHFVADEPPREAIDRLVAVLRDTQGDLGAVSRALVRLPQAWTPPLGKIRAPQDFVVAVLRAMDAPPEEATRGINGSALLGQPLWRPPAPIGWPDRASDWAQPEAILRRVEWTYGIAGRGASVDLRAVGEAVLGPLLPDDTSRAAARAGSAREALTLVLTSPEFQRR